MLMTKEEIIVLRTIFLEFGDEDLREKRLSFPYENMVSARTHKDLQKRKANLRKIIDEIGYFQNDRVDEVVFDGYLADDITIISGISDALDEESQNIPDIDKLVIDETDETYAVKKSHEDMLDHVALGAFSNSVFFIQLRKGLYYKATQNYEKAVELLLGAHEEYCKVHLARVENIQQRCLEILESRKQILDGIKKYGSIDNYMISPEWSEKCNFATKAKDLSPEMLVTLEEMPAFHIGEIYRLLGDKSYSEFHETRQYAALESAQKCYGKAKEWLKKSERWHDIVFCGGNIDGDIVAQIFGIDEAASQRLAGFEEEESVAMFVEIEQNSKDFGVLTLPVLPFKRNCYWALNWQACNNKLEHIERERFLATAKAYEAPSVDVRAIEKFFEALETAAKRKLALETAEQLEKLQESVAQYQAIIPDLGKVSMPMKNMLKLNHIFQEGPGAIALLDKHFDWHGFNWLRQQFDIGGKVKNLRILCGPGNIDENFKNKFLNIERELASEGTKVELRVFRHSVFHKFHDRWLVTDQSAYNIPPISSMMKGQLGEIKNTSHHESLALFEKYWPNSIDILTGDWNEIQQLKAVIKQNKQRFS